MYNAIVRLILHMEILTIYLIYDLSLLYLGYFYQVSSYKNCNSILPFIKEISQYNLEDQIL